MNDWEGGGRHAGVVGALARLREGRGGVMDVLALAHKIYVKPRMYAETVACAWKQ